MNITLMSKWWWLLITNHNSTLVRLLRDKYGPRRGSWSTKSRYTMNNSAFWKDLNKIGGMFWQSVIFKIGRGSQVGFWKDRWCTTNSLRAMFSSIFELATDKDATGACYWQCENWNVG